MLHTVVKGTNTVAEFKVVKAQMETLTKEYSSRHVAASETWEHGEPVKAWWGKDDRASGLPDMPVLCIEYQDGAWWHYNELGEWW